jgi:Rieske Fe-S protein
MRQLVLKKEKYLFIFFLLIFFIPSCDRINESPIPDVYVSLNVNLIIANELNVPGSSVLFPGYGYGGVIIYCEGPGSWYAFDAACTYEATRNCIVVNDAVIADCPCCGSQFVLLGGAYPTQAPATIPLKQYNVSLLNNTTLRVYN